MRIHDYEECDSARDRRRERVQKTLSSPLLSAVLSLAAVIALVETVWGQNLATLWKKDRLPANIQADSGINRGLLPEDHLGIASLLDVSYTSAAYLDAEKVARMHMEELMNSAYEDLTQYGEASYTTYMEAIQELLDDIEAMENLPVRTLSPLADFKEYCDTYYQRVSSFFETVQRNESFALTDYNDLAKWLSETTNTYDKIKEVFDENGIPYSVKMDEDREEYIVYTVSSIGTF